MLVFILFVQAENMTLSQGSAVKTYSQTLKKKNCQLAGSNNEKSECDSRIINVMNLLILRDVRVRLIVPRGTSMKMKCVFKTYYT